MRLFIIGLAFVLVLLPTLLILFAHGKTLRTRIVWAMFSFLAPIVMYAVVRSIPLLMNNVPEAQQWERFLGVVLSASGFFLPWIFFALFLHDKPKNGGGSVAK